MSAKRNSTRCTQIRAAGQRANFSRGTITGWRYSGGKTCGMTVRGGSRVELVRLR